MDNYVDDILLLRFWTTNQVTIYQRGDSEFLIKAVGSPAGLDTTRVFPSWEFAARHVIDVAKGQKAAAA